MSNALILNEKKMEIVFFDSHIPGGQLTSSLGLFATFLSDTASDLGVLLDSSFKLDKQVSTVVKSSVYQLHQIAKAKPYMPCKDLEKLIYAFITSRLNYCNSLYFGLQSTLLRRLQLVQNAAARLLTGTGRFDWQV